jgi:hypothetical protein
MNYSGSFIKIVVPASTNSLFFSYQFLIALCTTFKKICFNLFDLPSIQFAFNLQWDESIFSTLGVNYQFFSSSISYNYTFCLYKFKWFKWFECRLEKPSSFFTKKTNKAIHFHKKRLAEANLFLYLFISSWFWCNT